MIDNTFVSSLLREMFVHKFKGIRFVRKISVQHAYITFLLRSVDATQISYVNMEDLCINIV